MATAIACTLALGVATPVAAHNYLVASTPTAGETLTAMPEAFFVTTNDDLLQLSGNAGGFAMQVTDAEGRFYGDGCVTVEGATMSAVAELGEPGPYAITWQVVSGDGHTVSDSFEFTWQPADSTARVSEGSASAPVCGVAGQEKATAEPTAPAAEPGDDAATPAPEASDVSSPSGWLWLGGALLVVLAAAAVALLARARRKA